MDGSSRRPRPPRADARRNHDRVLAAARASFAAQGRAAQMDDIAARAGVSIATVYRHFPDKEAIFATLIAENSRQAAAFAQKALAEADT